MNGSLHLKSRKDITGTPILNRKNNEILSRFVTEATVIEIVDLILQRCKQIIEFQTKDLYNLILSAGKMKQKLCNYL